MPDFRKAYSKQGESLMKWEYQTIFIRSLGDLDTRPTVVKVNEKEHKVVIGKGPLGGEVKGDQSYFEYLEQAGKDGWETSGNVTILSDRGYGLLILKRPLE